jgi:hypothetical protein
LCSDPAAHYKALVATLWATQCTAECETFGTAISGSFDSANRPPHAPAFRPPERSAQRGSFRATLVASVWPAVNAADDVSVRTAHHQADRATEQAALRAANVCSLRTAFCTPVEPAIKYANHTAYSPAFDASHICAEYTADGQSHESAI